MPSLKSFQSNQNIIITVISQDFQDQGHNAISHKLLGINSFNTIDIINHKKQNVILYIKM